MRAHICLLAWLLVLTTALSSESIQNQVFRASRRSALEDIVAGLSAATVTTIANPSPAISDDTVPDKLRNIYDSGSSTYDELYSDSLVSKALDFPSLRASLLSKAYGDVLEIGVGTGLNLPYYPNDGSKMTSYTAIDVSPKMMEQAKMKIDVGNVAPSLEKLNKQGKVRFRIEDVNTLADVFDGHKFDCVIDTFSLCVFPQPIKALEQARSVLKPGGKILLLEHQDSLLGKALDPTRGIADVIGTCRYNDDVFGLLKSAGFDEVESSKSYAGGFLLEVVAS